MARNFFNYVNLSYSGGLNNTDNPDNLSENEASTLKNCYINTKGSLVKRSGLLLDGNDSGDTAITGGIGWIEDDGTKWELRTTGTELQYNNSGTWTTLDNGFTSGLPTEFVVANNKVYIFNGTDNTHSFDGTSTTLNNCLTDLGTSVPTGKYATFWKNYMFVFGSSKLSGTTYPARVWFSNLADPDTWTTGTDYFDANISDGQEGTGISPLGELLVIFKRRSYYIMSGSSPGDWRISTSVNNLQNVDNAVGCTSHRSIVQVGNDLWFMSDDGMRSVRRNEDATTPQTGLVMGKVQGTIDTFNKSHLDKVAATLFNKRVYVAYPTGSNTYNNEVLVADTRIFLEDPMNPHPWVVYTGWNVSCWHVHIPSTSAVLYAGEATGDSLTYKAETGKNDNSATIDFDYRSPMIDLREPDMKKTFRFLKASAKQGNNIDITVQTSIDGQVFATQGNLNIYDGGAIWNSATWDTDTWAYLGEVKEKFALGVASEQLMIRYNNNKADEAVTINPYTLAIKVKKIK